MAVGEDRFLQIGQSHICIAAGQAILAAGTHWSLKQPLSDSQRKLTGLRSITVKKISEQIADFFKNEGIRYGCTKGGCFRADFKGHSGVFSVLIDADDENRLLGAFTFAHWRSLKQSCPR